MDVSAIYKEAKADGKSVANAIKASFEDTPNKTANAKHRDVIAITRMMLEDNKDGERWSEDKQADCDRLFAMADQLKGEARLEQHQLDDQAAAAWGDTRPTSGASGWVDGEGRPVAVYGPNDNIASPSAGRGHGLVGNTDERVGLADICRAMKYGGGSNAVRASLSEGSDSAGGVTVPTDLSNRMIDVMRAKTRAIQAGAQTVALSTEKTTMARMDSDPVASWRLEQEKITESSPTFSSVKFEAKSLAVLVKVSVELLQDSVNLEDALINAFGSSMGISMDHAMLFGSGEAPEPLGLYGTEGVQALSMGANGAAPKSYAELLDIVEALETANSAPPSAMIWAPRTARQYSGLTDRNGQPLMMPQAIADVPKLSTTQVPTDMTHGTSEKASPILAGDFSQLMLGVRQSMRIQILDQPFATSLQVAFLAHLRCDVAVAHPSSFVRLDGLVPASS